MSEPSDQQIEKLLSGPSNVLFASGVDIRQEQPCVLAGSFNPLHEGHLEMASFGAAHTGKPVLFELCLSNIDKPTLTLQETRQRIQQNYEPGTLVLTQAPTFLEKSAIFPGSVFLVGIDTLVRIVSPDYYDNDVQARDMALEEIAAFGCRFLVFGREIASRFFSLDDIELSPTLMSICDGVPESEFRSGHSSTTIRREMTDPEENSE